MAATFIRGGRPRGLRPAKGARKNKFVILGGEAPDGQGVKTPEYRAYSDKFQISIFRIKILSSVHPEIADFGSDQGRSSFETAGVACYVEDFK
jgi:hypothetical protein